MEMRIVSGNSNGLHSRVGIGIVAVGARLLDPGNGAAEGLSLIAIGNTYHGIAILGQPVAEGRCSQCRTSDRSS